MFYIEPTKVLLLIQIVSSQPKRLMLIMRILQIFLCSLVLISVHSYADSALEKLHELEPSSLLVLNINQQSIYSKEPERMLIPASTVKLLTALRALEQWGRGHRFETKILINKKANSLTIKGLGDPFLVSEEIDLIVKRIKEFGIRELNGIYADVTYFGNEVDIQGRGNSNNPYDATVSALAANFNTIQAKVTDTGVIAGERQTPITPIARLLAHDLPKGEYRINLGKTERSPEYFIELLVAKLVTAGVDVQPAVEKQSSDSELELLFSHYNSRSLDKVISAMLKYSNNFIANQLFLMLGAEKDQPPANLVKSQQALADFVQEHFDWSHYVLLDGAGLSRKNRLSARQLVDVIKKFAEYRDLMPIQNQQIRAKSGTLRGVSTYAGYLQKGEEWLPFALLINQPVQYRFRDRLAEELQEQLF